MFASECQKVVVTSMNENFVLTLENTPVTILGFFSVDLAEVVEVEVKYDVK